MEVKDYLMNKLKIPLALVHTVFGLCGAWVFLGNDYVSYRVGMFLTKSPDVYQLLTNLFAFAVLYSPFAFFLCAYLILRNKIFFRGPLLFFNILMCLVYVALTYHYINSSLELNSGLNLPLFSIYLAFICVFISYKLHKTKI